MLPSLFPSASPCMVAPEPQTEHSVPIDGKLQKLQNEADPTQSQVAGSGTEAAAGKCCPDQVYPNLAEHLLKGEWTEAARFKCAVSMLSCAMKWRSHPVDIRPQNMTYDPATGIVKMAKGNRIINHLDADDHPSLDGGPNFYASPERYWRNSVTEKTAVYSLGITLFNLFSENPSLFDVAESMPTAEDGINLNFKNLLPNLRKNSKVVVSYLENLLLDMVASDDYYRPDLISCLRRLKSCAEVYQLELTHSDEVRKMQAQLDFLQSQLRKLKGGKSPEETQILVMQYLEMQCADQEKRIDDISGQYKCRINTATQSLQCELDKAWSENRTNVEEKTARTRLLTEDKEINSSKEIFEGIEVQDIEGESLAESVFRQEHIVQKIFGELDFFSQINFLRVVGSNRSLHAYYSALLKKVNLEPGFYKVSDYRDHDAYDHLTGRSPYLTIRGVTMEDSTEFNPFWLNYSKRYHVVSMDRGRTYWYDRQVSSKGFVFDSDYEADEDYHLFLIISLENAGLKKSNDSVANTGPVGVGYLECAESHCGWDYSYDRDPRSGNLLVAPDWRSLFVDLNNSLIKKFIQHLKVEKYQIDHLLSNYFSRNKRDRINARNLLFSSLDEQMRSLRNCP